MKTRPVYISGGARTPFVKSLTTYIDVTTQDLMIAALQMLVMKMHLEGKLIGDVGLGAVINSSSLESCAWCGLWERIWIPYTGLYIATLIGVSLETTLQLALKISNYQIDTAIAEWILVMHPSLMSKSPAQID